MFPKCTIVRVTLTVSEALSTWVCSTPRQILSSMRKVGVLSIFHITTMSPLAGPDLTWRQYMCHVCNQSEHLFYDNLKEILMDRLESEKIVKTIEDLGLLSEEPISKKGTPIDTV